MNVHYTSLGLVNTRMMFAGAIRGGFAVPAYNFNNMEQLQAIILACLETQSPVIIQVSKGARDYADRTLLLHMGRGAVEMMKREAAEKGAGEIPIALHLDHGDSYDLCVSCIESGFSSVMIDGSHLPYEENATLTRKVADFAHLHDVTVEGELGVLAGVEDEVSAAAHTYTRPEEVEDFVCGQASIHWPFPSEPLTAPTNSRQGRRLPSVWTSSMKLSAGFPAFPSFCTDLPPSPRRPWIQSIATAGA